MLFCKQRRKKKKKRKENGRLLLYSSPPPRSSFPAWQAHWVCLVFHTFVKSMVCIWPCRHGFSSCMELDMCLLYILWDAEKREGGLECWCPLGATFKCVRCCVFFFFMQGNCLLFSEKCWEQEAIWRDGHHNSNSNWMGCTASAQWAQACGQITRACLLYVIPMKMWLWRWNINHDQLGIHRIHIPVIKFITWSSRQRFVLRKHLSKQQEKSKKSLASSLRKYWPQTISASMENNTINN